MKLKLQIASLFLITSPLLTFAQQVPNGGLDEWEITPVGAVEKPIGWDSPDVIAGSLGITQRVVEKEATVTHSGSFAAKLTTKELTSPFLPSPVTVPGTLALGVITFNPATLEAGVVSGFPMDEAPDALSGFFRYSPAAGDTMNVAVIAKKDGEIMGQGVYRNSDNTSEYTAFSAEISYFTADIPDSIQIIITSSGGFASAVVGSILFIDDLALTGLSSVESISGSGIKANIFPNPTSHFITIDNPSNYTSTLEVYSLTGVKMDEIQLIPSLNTIDVKHYASGIYMVRIIHEGNQLYSGKFKVAH